MHLLTHKDTRDGIYHVRIYSVPRREDQERSDNGDVGSMPRHWEYILAENPKGPTNFDERLVSIGSNKVAIDGEFLLGAPEFSNVKLTLRSDTIFYDIITEARNLNRELWCEICLEQPITDCPPLKAHELFYPKKKRLWFWGKLLRHDTKGKVNTQEIISEGADKLIRTKTAKHSGDLELPFVHWLKVIGSEPVEQFLLDYRSKFIQPEEHFLVSDFFYAIIKKITPVQHFMVADHRLVTADKYGDSIRSVSRCNFELERTLKGNVNLTKQLWELEGAMRIQSGQAQTSNYTVLFHHKGDTGPNDKDHGEHSLFARWKDMSQAIYEFSREFFLRFQVELPCMEDSYHPNIPRGYRENLTHVRALYPASCAKWLFMEVDQKQKRYHATTLKGTLEYSPAAMWIKKIKIEEPNFVYSDVVKPSRQYDEFEYPYEGGQDVGYKTIFSFIRQVAKWNTVTGVHDWVDEFHGCELFVRNDNNVPDTEYVRYVNYPIKNPNAPGALFNSVGVTWANVHLRNMMDIWGGVRATVSFDAKRIGIEPFGASNKNITPKPKATFGLYDWGEFPLLRGLDIKIGLLFGPETNDSIGDFTVIDIDREPEGNSKVTLLMRGEYTTVDIPLDDDPDITMLPPPPPPPHNTPPTITFDNGDITGASGNAYAIPLTAIDDYGVVRVKMYLDGAFLGNAIHGTGNEWTFSWNTLLTTNGAHTMQARAEDDEGLFGYNTIGATVTN